MRGGSSNISLRQNTLINKIRKKPKRMHVDSFFHEETIHMSIDDQRLPVKEEESKEEANKTD